MRLLPWILLLALTAPACQTASGPTFGAGMGRSAFSAEWSKSDVDAPGSAGDFDMSTLGVNAVAGAFLGPEIEGGVKLGYLDQEIGNQTTKQWAAALYGRYYFQSHGTLRPWGELTLGYAQGDNGPATDRNLYYGLALGLTQFLTESTALELGLGHEARSFDFGNGDTDYSTTALTVGYAVFW